MAVAAPDRKIYLLCFVVGLGMFAGASGERLFKPSRDNHFVLQADAWLHGRLSISEWPRGTDDPAIVTTVRTRDGALHRGRFLAAQPAFRTTTGETIANDEVVERVSNQYFVSFPSFPAVVMLPQTLLAGTRANDVATTVLVAAALLPLLLYLLTCLSRQGFTVRTLPENLWLVAALGFGSVLYFSAVQGRVWFTAHVIGVFLSIAYLTASLGARAPFWAGLALACATLTRTPMALLLPFFLLELYRVRRHERPVLLRKAFSFVAPLIVLGIAAMILNHARFDSVFEFGHTYLAVRQQAQIEALGLFDFHYLGRNLKVAFGLLPQFLAHAPFVKINGHGLALWFTSPYLILLLWPKSHALLARALWLTVALIAVPSLIYQNTGWLQFGYRFCLDYMACLIVLLAMTTHRYRWPIKTLIVLAIAVNLFGALTFAREWQYYDLTTYDSL